MTICELLDHARNVGTTHTSSDKPAPALAPATVEGKSLADSLIALVHSPIVDPNFLCFSARNADELNQKLHGPAGKMIDQRHEALQGYLAEAQSQLQARLARANQDPPAAPANSGHSVGAHNTAGVNGGIASFEAKTVAFLQEKKDSNTLMYQIYHSEAIEEQQEFFSTSRKAWTESLPEVLNKLESGIKGVYALGDQIVRTPNFPSLFVGSQNLSYILGPPLTFYLLKPYSNLLQIK